MIQTNKQKTYFTGRFHSVFAENSIAYLTYYLFAFTNTTPLVLYIYHQVSLLREQLQGLRSGRKGTPR